MRGGMERTAGPPPTLPTRASGRRNEYACSGVSARLNCPSLMADGGAAWPARDKIQSRGMGKDGGRGRQDAAKLLPKKKKKEKKGGDVGPVYTASAQR